MAAKSCSSRPPQQRMPLALLRLLGEVAQLALAHTGAGMFPGSLSPEFRAHESPLLGAYRWHGHPPATQPTPTHSQKVLSAPSYHSTPTPSISAKAPMASHVAHWSSWRSCVHSFSHRSGWACGPQVLLIAGPPSALRAP